MIKRGLIGCLLGTSLMAIAQGAAAQSQTPDETAEAPAGERIVVTGSRIQQQGYNAPTPVTMLGSDDLARKAPSNIPDALNQLPQFLGSINQNQQADTAASNPRSGNFLDIRALGPQRVLVLMNGRRVPPTSNNGATDTNLIPQLLVERVDVVTGGASAAYGSDAVSGVVNFVLDDDYEGLKGVAQAGISTYYDNESYKAGLAFGTSLADDQLHVLLSAERYYSAGIPDRSSRFTSTGENTLSGMTIAGSGTEESPYRYVSGALFNFFIDEGKINDSTVPDLINMKFEPDGSLTPFDAGIPIPGRGGYGIGGDGALFASKDHTGAPSLETNQLFGQLSFDVSPDVRVFVQGTHNTSLNEDRNFSPIASASVIFGDNPYLHPSVAAQMGPDDTITVARYFKDWGPPLQQMKNRATIINAGIEGTIGGDYNFDVYYTHGFSRFDVASNQIDFRKYFAAVDAVRDESGTIVCNITLTNPGLADDCIPLDIMGEGSGSQAARDYVLGTSTWGVTNTMDVFAANISGEPFELWAGPVGVAIGAEYREQSLVQFSNADPAVPTTDEFAGRRGVTTSNRFFTVNSGTGAGSYNVKEVYGEIAVPLASGPGIGDLDVNGAVRLTDYSTSGTVTTWKVGATYEPIPDIRFRGTLSRDIRAPSLYELFAGQNQTTSPLTDPLTNTSGSVDVITGGNPDLQPEVAKTFTAGVVLSPSFAPGFNLSIDYYQIDIDDAIARPFGHNEIVNLCAASGYTSDLCDLIERPTPDSYPTRVRTQLANLAQTKTSGIDFEASYRAPVGNGTFGARLLASHLIKFDERTSDVSDVRHLAGNADKLQGFFPLPLPQWRGNLELSYSTGGFRAGVQERYVGSFNKSDQFVYEDNKVPATFYTDLNVAYSFDVGGVTPELFLNVNNVFDQKGRLFLISALPALNVPISRNVHDVVGRYFTAGVRFEM